ncbi:MAG: hypothetical protein DMD82_07865 [Candidatus Rokuibacteriota bacterium]|nr:MAG: hypothetical protein DMD82_07865 [Candidatus Rokubacteria bacterium]
MAQGFGALMPREVAALLHSAGVAIRAELTGLPESVVRWHPRSGEWCILEALGHLIEAERRGFAGRIRQILDQEEPRFQAWDQVEVGRARRDCSRDAAALLDEFTRLRDESIALVEGLRETDLSRGGEHPTVGHLRVGDLLHEWLHHDRNHLKQMMANVQAFVWPSMGNAQRFSDE